MPDSPVLLRLTSTSSHFMFFKSAFAIYSKLVSSGIFDLPANINMHVYKQLHIAFSTSDSEPVSRISLSGTQINILCCYIAAICYALLGDDHESFKSRCAVALPLLSENWDKKFLQNTGKTLSRYKEQFERFPEFDRVLYYVILNASHCYTSNSK